MILYQWGVVVMITLVIFLNRASRAGAITILLGYLFYETYVVDLPGYLYYSACATLNLVIGAIIHPRNILASYCSYMLVFLQAYGYMMYEWEQTQYYYDTISLIILTAQLLALIPRGQQNGFRYYLKYLMASFDGFDSRKENPKAEKRCNEQKK